MVFPHPYIWRRRRGRRRKLFSIVIINVEGRRGDVVEGSREGMGGGESGVE